MPCLSCTNLKEDIGAYPEEMIYGSTLRLLQFFGTDQFTSLHCIDRLKPARLFNQLQTQPSILAVDLVKLSRAVEDVLYLSLILFSILQTAAGAVLWYRTVIAMLIWVTVDENH